MQNPIESLFKDSYEQLVLFAIGYVKDLQTAEDIVMSLFTRLLERNEAQQSLQDVSKEEASNYLFLVLKHRCLDHLRVHTNRLQIQSMISYQIRRVERNRSIDSFEREAIERMIRILGKQESKILKQHLEGYSNEEIAEENGISYNTVRNTLTNARKKIRAVWDSFMV